MEADNNPSRPVSTSKKYGVGLKRMSVSTSKSPFTPQSRSGTEGELRPRTLEERLQDLGIDLDRIRERQDINPHRQSPPEEKGKVRKKLSFSDSRDSSDLSDRKSARLSEDISRRISGISSSMEEYDKKVRDVTQSLNVAYRKSVQDSMKMRMGKESGGSSPDSLEVYLKKSKDSLAKDLLVELGPDYKPVDTSATPSSTMGPAGDANAEMMKTLDKVGNISPRKIFGLDTTAILESSSSDDSSEEEDEDDEGSSSEEDTEDSGAAAMRISIRQPVGKKEVLKKMEENVKNGRAPRPKFKRKVALPKELEEPRSLSPIMPTLPDKQFQSMLERREERVSRHLNNMKNELQQLNQKVEIDRRKAAGTRGKLGDASYQGRPMRLMKSKPDEVASEFNEFVQATGGKAGGWDRKDHVSFMKAFDVWKNHPKKLMESLKKELPHKKPQDIAGHIKWYERFEELSTKNKANVQKWSLEKRKENEMVFQMGSASQRAKLEGEKLRQEHLRMVREQERDKSKQKLAQWKRTQAVRSATATTPTSMHHEQQSDTGSGEPLGASSHSKFIQRQRRREKEGSSSVLGEYRDDQGNLDISGVRQHILDITAKVHSLDHPKREFLPPRPLPRKKEESSEDLFRSYSHTQMKGMKLGEGPDMLTRRGSVRLPEIDPESLSRPGSRPDSRPIIAQQRSKLSEFRERDSRIVEAKKKAVEIARERRRSNLNQLTSEELKRRVDITRIISPVASSLTQSFPPLKLLFPQNNMALPPQIRSRAGTSSKLHNPTKQSDLRKSLTHLDRLEMLSKQDLRMMGQPLPPSSSPDPGTPVGSRYVEIELPPIINNVKTKGVPSWRLPPGS